MIALTYSREFEEQMAEALPILGAAALEQSLMGVHKVLFKLPDISEKKLALWIWTEGHARFGTVTRGRRGCGLRIWVPARGHELMVATGRTELAVSVGSCPAREKGRYIVSTNAIESSARTAAVAVLTELAKLEKRRLRRTRRLGRGQSDNSNGMCENRAGGV
ncbi:MAG: hypothetical protein GX547_07560 [Phycisphaerae bacterium]|nr:hypothetical protein [Phycisphaerae bacterium]